MLSVLHVTEVASGGVATYVRRLCSWQQQRGDRVTVLGPDLELSDSVPHRRWAMDRRRPLAWPAAVAALQRAILDVRPDVVHLHSFFGGLAGRLRTVHPAVVYQPHAWAVDAVGSRAGALLVRRWESWAGRRTDGLACVSVDEQQQGLAMGVTTPSRVVGVPVDVDWYRPPGEDERRAARAALAPTPERLLVCVGRISQQKGQDRVAAAWERVRPAGCVLVLLGDGDPRRVDALREAAPTTWGRSLRWAGPTSDVRTWLWAADGVVQPSRYEGMSTAVGEALATGLPVWSAPVNGAAEALVRPPEAPAGGVHADVTEFLLAAAAALDDPERVRSLHAVARARALRLHAPGAVLDRIDALYADTLQGGGVTPG